MQPNKQSCNGERQYDTDNNNPNHYKIYKKKCIVRLKAAKSSKLHTKTFKLQYLEKTVSINERLEFLYKNALF